MGKTAFSDPFFNDNRTDNDYGEHSDCTCSSYRSPIHMLPHHGRRPSLKLVAIPHVL